VQGYTFNPHHHRLVFKSVTAYVFLSSGVHTPKIPVISAGEENIGHFRSSGFGTIQYTY
jgi:hypothetical protein